MTLRRLFGKKDASASETRHSPQISNVKSADLSMEERSKHLQDKLDEMHDIVKELGEHHTQQREEKLFKKHHNGKSDPGKKKKTGFFNTASESIPDNQDNQEEEMLIDKSLTGNAK
jgi:hypothetical protein